MEIKFQYTVKKPNGHIFSETFPLRDIERGYVSSWLKNNSVGVTSEIFKRQYIGMKDRFGKGLYENDLLRDIRQKPGIVGGSVLQVKYNKYTASFQLHRICTWQTFDMTAVKTRDGVCEESCGYVKVGNTHENPELLT